MPALVISATAVAVGVLAVFYGIEQYRGAAMTSSSAKTRQADSSSAGEEKNPGNAAAARPKEGDRGPAPMKLPPPPAAIPVREAEPGKLYLPAAAARPHKSEARARSRYLPPLPVAAAGPKKAGPGRTRREASRYASGGALPNNSDAASPASVLSGPPKGPVKASMSKRGMKRPRPGGSTGTGSSSEPAREAGRPSPQNRDETVAEVPKPAMGPAGSAPQVIGLPSPDESGGPSGERKAVYRGRARIAKIVEALRRDMSSPGNEGLVEDRLRELVSLKGRDDPYVLQITAYWRMKLGDLERASSLLGRLLQRDPENLVAGLNMAVLEFRSGRRSNALRRLKKIRNLYPEDERVAELLARMKP